VLYPWAGFRNFFERKFATARGTPLPRFRTMTVDVNIRFTDKFVDGCFGFLLIN
jgi:hypothetical protein